MNEKLLIELWRSYDDAVVKKKDLGGGLVKYSYRPLKAEEGYSFSSEENVMRNLDDVNRHMRSGNHKFYFVTPLKIKGDTDLIMHKLAYKDGYSSVAKRDYKDFESRLAEGPYETFYITVTDEDGNPVTGTYGLSYLSLIAIEAKNSKDKDEILDSLEELNRVITSRYDSPIKWFNDITMNNVCAIVVGKNLKELVKTSEGILKIIEETCALCIRRVGFFILENMVLEPRPIFETRQFRLTGKE